MFWQKAVLALAPQARLVKGWGRFLLVTAHMIMFLFRWNSKWVHSNEYHILSPWLSKKFNSPHAWNCCRKWHSSEKVSAGPVWSQGVVMWVIERNKRREKVKWKHFFSFTMLGNYSAVEKWTNCSYKQLCLIRDTSQSSFTWVFWLLWDGVCSFQNSVTMEESINWKASWYFYFSVFIFQGGVLRDQQEMYCTNSFSLRMLDHSPEPQWMFKELNGMSSPAHLWAWREVYIGFHAEVSD